MARTIALAVAVSLLGHVSVNAQEAPPRGWASKIAQDKCTSDKGLRWREAYTLPAAATGTGKDRQVSATCVVDSKAMRAVLYGLNK